MLQNKYTRLAFVAAWVVLTDQVSKALILKYLPVHHSISVVAGFFDITHIHNPGGAFGLMANMGAGIRTVVFLFISSLAVGLIFYLYIKTPRTHSFLAIGFALIFGGAIGNLIDRIVHREVIDFLDFHIGSYYWPTFNLADSFIVVGVGVLLLEMFFEPEDDPNTAVASEPPAP